MIELQKAKEAEEKKTQEKKKIVKKYEKIEEVKHNQEQAMQVLKTEQS